MFVLICMWQASAIIAVLAVAITVTINTRVDTQPHTAAKTRVYEQYAPTHLAAHQSRLTAGATNHIFSHSPRLLHFPNKNEWPQLPLKTSRHHRGHYPMEEVVRNG